MTKTPTTTGTAAAVAGVLGFIGLSVLMSSCGGSDGEATLVAVHIPHAVQAVNGSGETWVYPQCIDTNITVAQYEEDSAAYLLNGSDCVYAVHNHQPYKSSDGVAPDEAPNTAPDGSGGGDGGDVDVGGGTGVVVKLPPAIVGTYSATVSVSGMEASEVPLVITSQEGESFSGTTTVPLMDGSSLGGAVSGTIKADRSIRFRVSTSGGTGVFSGTTTGDPVQYMSGTASYMIYFGSWRASRQ